MRDDGNEGGKERKSEGIDGVRRCAQYKGASVEKEEANGMHLQRSTLSAQQAALSHFASMRAPIE